MSLQDKTALVTGASRGIGAATLQALGQQGAYVVGTATSEKGAASITDAIKAAGLKGHGAVLNVTDLAAIDTFFEQQKADNHMPDILVNNAGITRDNLLMRMSEQEWGDIMQTNLTAIFRMSKACLRHMMKARWGRIITTGSVVGSSGNPGQSNYCAAKAGVIGFSKSLAQEIGSRNITVNVVAPGFIESDMTSGLPEDLSAKLIEHIPMGRMGAPEEIANTITFLASDAASYVTGHTLHVNGGMYMA